MISIKLTVVLSIEIALENNVNMRDENMLQVLSIIAQEVYFHYQLYLPT